MGPDEVLKVLEKSGALLKGHFELRSGLHGDQFFQCANVLQHPSKAGSLGRALAAKVREYFASQGVEADTVVSPALGGIIVGHEVARGLGLRSIFAEKQEGRLILRRFEVAQDERFVVVEDVVTRGGRVQETIDIVTASGGKVLAVAVLVNRSGGSVSFDCPMLSLLEVEPTTYDPEDCPLCAQGLPLFHPGS